MSTFSPRAEAVALPLVEGRSVVARSLHNGLASSCLSPVETELTSSAFERRQNRSIHAVSISSQTSALRNAAPIAREISSNASRAASRASSASVIWVGAVDFDDELRLAAIRGSPMGSWRTI
ncbi:MAG: hypothetical protein H6870_16625 [Methylobacteriaceae bacterium]|nr:hypothetical protein [Methylobacteriaceae bacterium]